MAAQKHIRIKLREVNRHLVCRLCRGYYVDATTIAECLHSFCRSCIIKYLEKNSFCPICEVQIHKTKPYLNLRLDKALQDVVYKVVPGLYHDEMKRRRDFYSKRQEQIPFATPEQCGLEERIIFSPEDSISLSLEYLESDECESETVSSKSSESGENPDVLSFPQQLGLIKLKNGEGKASRRESQDVPDSSLFPKRYLQCPAVVNIGHLKKFIKMKHDVTDKMQVSIIHKRVPLPDHYTLMDVAYIFTWKRSSPLRFFYQIYRTKKHSITVQPPSQETKESNLKTTAEDQKSIKSMIFEKRRVIDAVNSGLEDNKSFQCIADKSNAWAGEYTQTVCSNVLKNVDGNKPVLETGGDKFEVIVKSEPNSNSVKDETANLFEIALGKDAELPSNKSEKSKALVGVSSPENKNKEDNQKRKSVKVENNANVQEVKENKLSLGRLLLNPISGQLESVPSSDSVKSSVNGGIFFDGSKESTDYFKREIGSKEQKKLESKNSKDSKKSNVNLLKSFRKEKFSAGKEDKSEVRKSRGSSLTITAVPKNDKSLEKETVNFSVEIKAENKESEYDFDGSSPPSKIIPLQEFSKYSKYSKYMADHRDKWLSKESKNKWMPLKDFREKMLKENNSEADPLKKSKKKLVPSLYKLNSEKNKTSIRKTPNGKLTGEKWKGNKTSRTINPQTQTEDKKAELKEEAISNKVEFSLKPKKTESKDKKAELKVEVVPDMATFPLKPRKTENKDKKADLKMEALRDDAEFPPRSKKTENKERKVELKVEIVRLKTEFSPKPSKLENRNSESNVKLEKDNSLVAQENGVTKCEPKRQSDDGNKFSPTGEETSKSPTREKAEGEDLKNKVPNTEARKSDQLGAMDLSKMENSPKSDSPLESLIDMAIKTALPKNDDKMVEALIAVAQKQSLEPLLKIPHYSQMLKNSGSQGSRSPVKNISQNEISQALQFLEDLRSDIKVFEAKNQLNPSSVLEQFAQKSGNFQPYQELYQQKIDLIRRLKRHQQIMPNDSETPQRKLLKLSPTSESKKKLSPPLEQKAKSSASDETAQYKSSIDKTLSQIQLLELQTRMLAAQNYKNLPAFLQYYNRPFCAGSSSPNKSNQQKTKPPSHSPNSHKSPQSLSSPSANVPLLPTNSSTFFNSQNYLINAGLNSEMTYHQMFQSYLNQQEQMNQVKLSQIPKKPVKFSEVSAKSLQDKYYVPQTTAKKQEPNSSTSPTQKT